MQKIENLTKLQAYEKADKDDYLVVMTACIDPITQSPLITRKDPIVRLHDYMGGLRFWLNLTDNRIRKILFIENSGYPLDSLQYIAENENPFQKDCEFLSISCNNIPPGVHYGYGEFCMIDEALSRSRLVLSARYMIKATGRLTFPRISRLLDSLPVDYLFAADSRSKDFFNKYSSVYVPTQLIIFSLEFYKNYLLGKREELLTHRFGKVEDLICQELMKFRGQPGAILRWSVNCCPSGQAAHWNKSYDNLQQQAINAVRAICRFLFPNWWI